MDFGSVPGELLNQTNFNLSAEPAFNSNILNGNAKADPKLYIGCDKWAKKEWIGKIYPAKAKEKDFLDYYAAHYNSVELNATHYKIYDEAVIKKWTAKAGNRDFKFCTKMYQGVTHRGSLQGKDHIMNQFFRSIVAFEEMLGPVFIQLSETFSPKRKEELFEFLQSLPKDLQFFLEVRHRDWFANPGISEELFTKLASLNIGAVITDTAGRRDCAHMHLTLPKTFIRYVGNSLHASDYTRIDEWVKRMKYWLNKGMEELYFFMHMHDEATSPELTVYLVDKMNKELGLNLIKPTFIEKQKSLFD